MSSTAGSRGTAVQTTMTRPKATWQAPTVRVVGDLRDLVLGGGKSGSTFDMDPTNNTKKGTG